MGFLQGADPLRDMVEAGHKADRIEACVGERQVARRTNHLCIRAPVNDVNPEALLRVCIVLPLAIEAYQCVVSGADVEKVGQFAANIRAQKPPEPYKGKGIRYDGEVIRRKQGKKAA